MSQPSSPLFFCIHHSHSFYKPIQRCMVTLLYLTTPVPLHSNRFARRKAARRVPLFQFAVSRGPLVSIQCIAVNIMFLPHLQRALEIRVFGSQTRVSSN
jgi:hypothetical protein